MPGKWSRRRVPIPGHRILTPRTPEPMQILLVAGFLTLAAVVGAAVLAIAVEGR